VTIAMMTVAALKTTPIWWLTLCSLISRCWLRCVRHATCYSWISHNGASAAN